MKITNAIRIAAIIALTLLITASGYSKNFQLNKNVGIPTINFLSKAPMEDIKGVVKPDKITSFVNFDIASIEATNGKISLEVTAMETGLTKRDEHMWGKDWLDAANYPTISFDLQKLAKSKIESDAGGKTIIKAFAEGNITIHGKTKYISSPVTVTFLKESAGTKKRASGDLFLIEGKFDVALKDFNYTGVKGVVGTKVGEVINIDYKLFFNSK